MSKLSHFSILSIVLILFTACSTPSAPKDAKPQNPLYETSPLYAQVNLHYDSNRNRLTSVNYQHPTYIPRCRKVQFNKITSEWAIFTDQKTNQQYTYLLSGHTKMPFRKHLKKVFGPSCTETKNVDKLNKKDRKGIEIGEVREGMTKQGVIYAIGYPPDHQTPSTDANQWTYWRHRFNRFLVIFNDDGRVTKVKD